MVALAYSNNGSFVDRVTELLNRLDYRVADSDVERQAIFRLRYEAYRREKAIRPNFTKSFADDYDDAENCWLFGLDVEGKLSSSIRIHVATAEQPVCPSLSTFPDIIEPELEQGKVIIDPTRFVTDSTMTRLLPGLPYLTLRLCWMAAEYFEAEHFMVAIRDEHKAFYKRTFDHRLICPARPYPMLKDPICLMTLDHNEVADRLYRRYPFFRSNHFERRMLFDRSSSARNIAA